MHPQARDLLAALEPADHDVDYVADRANARAAALKVTGRTELAGIEDLTADAVPVRLYRPRRDAPLALYVHGGGWVLHDLETHDAFCRYFAHRTGWALLAVDYRRAPEHPYPAALDDVEKVVAWVKSGAVDRFEVDRSFLAAIGDSAGAHLIATLSVRNPHALDAQVLMYPPVDCTAELDSQLDNAALTGAAMEWFWRQYVGDADPDHPEISPLKAADFTSTPPSLVITNQYDVLAAQGRAYAAALAEAGVPVTAWNVDGMPHSFWRQPEIFEASRTTVVAVGAILSSWRADHARSELENASAPL